MVVNLVDNVGNEVEYYAIVELDSACGVTVSQYCADQQDCECTSWQEQLPGLSMYDIGFCGPYSNCCYMNMIPGPINGDFLE